VSAVLIVTMVWATITTIAVVIIYLRATRTVRPVGPVSPPDPNVVTGSDIRLIGVALEEEHKRRQVYEMKHGTPAQRAKAQQAMHGTPAQRAKAQQAMHELALDVDLRNGDGALWSIEYPAPKETP